MITLGIYEGESLEETSSERSLQRPSFQMRHLWKGEPMQYNIFGLIQSINLIMNIYSWAQTYKLLGTLKNHIKMLHVDGNKPHKCKYCGKVILNCKRYLI